MKNDEGDPGETRTERDSLGEVEVPADALYGSHTVRALGHQVLDEALPPAFVRALAAVKAAAARANRDLGVLEPDVAEAVLDAAREVAAGEHGDQFPLGAYQTGSGTSTNMNVNEVVANLAARELGEPVGEKAVHPNDHVNASQSSNDVVPTAINVAVLARARDELLPSLEGLREVLRGKSDEWRDVVKPGRTHLQDATPVTLGQEFSGYARQVGAAAEAVERNLEELREVPLGGTAVGTGINAPAGFGEMAVDHLSDETGLDLAEGEDRFALQSAHDSLLEVSGSLRRAASALSKVSDDLRLLVSGPRTALAEVEQPRNQPGSSIMPGKVNPVVPEAVIQACAQVHGLDDAVSRRSGELELDLTRPLTAKNLLEQVELLAGSARILREFVGELDADEERCRFLAEKTLALSTALNTAIGYDEAAEIAQEAYRSGRTVKEVAVEKGILDEEEAEELLDPKNLT